MGLENHPSTYRSIIEAVSEGRLNRLDDLMAADLLDHNPAPAQPPGLAGFKFWADTAREAFPDLAGTVEDTVAAGDKVAGRVTWRGTHHGDLLGLSGTGTPVQFSAFHIVRFSGGLAVEWWGTADLLSALLQVGGRVTAANAAD